MKAETGERYLECLRGRCLGLCGAADAAPDQL
jgi:hypothetical protein